MRQYFDKYITPESIAIDVGANIGICPSWLQRL
jgi:hypothetical protein